MNLNLLFWICWTIDLVAMLVLGWDLLRRWSNREDTPVGGSAWKSGKMGLLSCAVLVAGGLIGRYVFDSPKTATFIAAAPVAGVAIFFIVMIIGVLFGARMN